MKAIIIIVALIICIAIVVNRYNLMKAYYNYQTNALDEMEKKYDKQVEDSNNRIEELKNIAYLNATTNIWNIDYFLEKGEQALNMDYDHTPSFTLVAFSISNIGKINQLFGPTEGDSVVNFTAQTLKQMVSSRVYAQVYSNLFCILYVDRDDEYVESAINSLHDKLIAHDENVRIKTTYGIYRVQDRNMNIMDMINYAQLAQRFARDGEDDVCFKFFTDELNDKFENNKRMSEEMEKALDAHKFVVFLQPMYDLHSYRIVSAEALVRWDYPGKGMLSPFAFLPMFESTQLIQKLDYYMWEECMKTVRRWLDNKIEPTPVTMNISTAHLVNDKFVDYLVELRERYLIPKDMIILEIPEKGLTNISRQTIDVIKRLKEEEFTLCIDNFGSLSSPLNLLKDLPIDRIKLDRSFLAKNSESDEGLTILRYLVAMAKELDFTIITEGIETSGQAEMLLEIGCDIGQGYYFSKPVDIRTFDNMNKSRLSDMYRPDEYYPTFEDYERDLDLVVQFFKSKEDKAG